MKNDIAAIDERFSIKAFGIGLAVIAALYGGLIGFAVSNYDPASSTKKIPVITANVQRTINPAPYNFPPAPAKNSSKNPSPAELAMSNAGMDISEPATEQQTQIEITNDAPLRPAPIAGLYQDTAQGRLPVKSSDGLTPFEGYKKPFQNRGGAKMSVALRDFGLSAADSEYALENLPSTVTLVLSAYAADAPDIVRRARERGFEIWLELPMQGSNANDMGPLYISANLDIAQNINNLYAVMAGSTGYAGIAGEMTPSLSVSSAALRKTFEDIFGRGLGYFEMSPFGSQLIETLAADRRSPYISSNALIDPADPQAISVPEQIALQNGSAAFSIRTNRQSIDAIKTWIESLEGKNITPAPLSSLAAPK